MKIGIDMGHTVKGPNTGAVSLINESIETRVVGNKVIELLKKQGHTVVNCTIDTASSNSDSLSKRVKIANAQKLDLFVSIHFNASNGSGNGTEIFTNKAVKHEYAVRVNNKLAALGFTNRGIKDGSNLYVVKSTSSTAMLIEVCFVDNSKDVGLYTKNKDNIAIAIVEGIMNKSISNTDTIKIEEDEDMIPDTVKLHANSSSSTKDFMIEKIKLLQGVVKITQDGIATESLVKKLPELSGVETKGCVTVMQQILIKKGFLSNGSDTGIIGPANKNAIEKFKESVGIPTGKILIDRNVWRKLLEY